MNKVFEAVVGQWKGGTPILNVKQNDFSCSWTIHKDLVSTNEETYWYLLPSSNVIENDATKYKLSFDVRDEIKIHSDVLTAGHSAEPINFYCKLHIATINGATINTSICFGYDIYDTTSHSVLTGNILNGLVNSVAGKVQPMDDADVVNGGYYGFRIRLEEVAMSNDNNIVTLNESKTYLKIAQTDSTQDSFLSSLINIASDKIERYTRSCFKKQSFTEIYSGKGWQKLFTQHCPVISLANASTSDVQQKITPTSDWSDIETDLNYVMIIPSSPFSIHLYRNVFNEGVNNIRVKYYAGYETIPQSVKQVALEMVSEMYAQSRQGSGRLGQTSRNVSTGAGGSGSDSFMDLSEKHKLLLSSFILPVMYED